MKKRIIAIAIGVMLAMSALAGCGTGDGDAKTSADSESLSYTGEVTAISTDSITIKVSDTDEEITAAITDETSVTAGGMGQGGSAPDGAGASGQAGEPSQDTDGTDSTQTPPEKPDGESSGTDDTQSAPSGGNAPGSSDSSGQPQMPQGDMSSSEMPEMPEGDMSSSEMPEMPEGDMSSSEMPEMPDGAQGGTGGGDMSFSVSDISVGDSVTITLDESGNALTIEISMGDGGGSQPGESDSGDITYTAVNEYSDDAEISGESISSTGTDESAVLVTGGTVTMTDTAVTRTSQDSTGGDNSSSYGVGASVLNTGGTLKIEGGAITSDAAGGAGVFSYGDGVTYVSNTTIKTTQDTSGGIHVAGGGTLYAENLDVTTEGASSAAIRSDRGGGTMEVTGGTYTSNGTGSPAVYCTADITVTDADLTATGSEAVCIEGLNSLRLTDCALSGSMKDDSQNDCTWTVILYQSMSGDSEVGESTFEMTGGSLTSTNGGIFYTTNTESDFTIEDVDITASGDCEFFLRCTGNSNARGWGTSGSNGAQCSFSAISQEMNGDIIWDSISELDMSITDGSTLTGAVIDDESCAGSGGSGHCNISIDEDSTWIVTGNSTLTSLECEGTIKDASGNTVSIVGTDGTKYVTGTSQYTITVDSYSE